ncbi:MAG: YdeI/OmpD-associated family protein [Candidatus Saccharimonadales bacterium]
MALQRPRYPMPDDVQLALEARALMDEYLARPEYQQNDYIGWITRAKKEETRIKRLNQMLDELADGTAYMNMPYNAKV